MEVESKRCFGTIFQRYFYYFHTSSSSKKKEEEEIFISINTIV